MGWAKVCSLLLTTREATCLTCLDEIRHISIICVAVSLLWSAAQEWSQNLLKKLSEEEAADFKAKSSAGIKFLLPKLKELQL